MSISEYCSRNLESELLKSIQHLQAPPHAALRTNTATRTTKMVPLCAIAKRCKKDKDDTMTMKQ